MKKLAIFVVLISLNACAGFMPSFWDDNQSKKIIDVRQTVAHLDCAQPHLPQAQKIQHQLEWFQLYSESKGYLQQDVLILIKPMQETVNDFVKRSKTSQGSVAYCELKKKLLINQSATAAKAVLGRY
jgi:hypothetical protein